MIATEFGASTLCRKEAALARLAKTWTDRGAVLIFLLGAHAHRAVAQFGSALDWGSRGRGFKSRRPDEIAMVPRLHNLGTILVFGIGHISGTPYVQGPPPGSLRPHRVATDKRRHILGPVSDQTPDMHVWKPGFLRPPGVQGAHRYYQDLRRLRKREQSGWR